MTHYKLFCQLVFKNRTSKATPWDLISLKALQVLTWYVTLFNGGFLYLSLCHIVIIYILFSPIQWEDKQQVFPIKNLYSFDMRQDPNFPNIHLLV